MNHQRENRTNSTIYKYIKKKKKKKKERNLTEEQKHLYSHRLQDIESGFKSHLTLTCRVTQGKLHNDLRLNIFNSKWTETQLSPPRAVKLQGNAYLGLGIEVSPGASPCMKLL